MATTGSNTRVVLARRPEATATPDCFSVETLPLEPLDAGQIRVAVEYVSVDAGTRTMLRGEGFHAQVALGGVIHATGVGRVIETTDPAWPVGQAVRGRLGAQTIATVKTSGLARVDDSVGSLSLHLGPLAGSTGVTAWVGVRHIGKVVAGDTFVVSGAAGAVGSMAGQIAKLDGARVIGIAGGPAKCTHLIEHLGFDAAIDYKNDDVRARLRELCPDGVTVFFDNVGVPILDDVLDNLAMGGRVVICGAESQYDHMDRVEGPSLYLRLAERQATMAGFAYFHTPELIEPATAELTAWVRDGVVSLPETVLEGIERYPEALQFMFEGGNVGKLLVKAS
jgi:NADPH-dependent curcumin reductase CurA